MSAAAETYKPVCRNVQTGDLYEYQGGTRFKNLRTGKEGELKKEDAEKFLKENVDASAIINEYPIVAELIQKLNLVMEKTCEQ